MQSKDLKIRAIVAMGRNREIGFRGLMPWHLPEDLRHFKELTLGHPVIMGRRTWLSLPRRPLPGRLNIVLTRSGASEIEKTEQVKTASSIEEAMELCAGQPTPYIIGGGTIYAEAMPLLDGIDVTRIDADFPEADTFFPEISPEEWQLSEQSEPIDSKSALSFRYETYERRNNQ